MACASRSALPLVSVVVPTIRRPALVLRAIDSVLRQTYPAIEIIVIVDGPDDATRRALAAIDDRRLRVLHNAVAEGPGPARNRAGAAAQGDWIAFLDDDDEWLPEKLTRQLAGCMPDQDIVLSCRCRVSTPRADYVWPRRLCAPDEPIDEYLFARRSLRRDDAYLATPTIVLPRRLFAASGFGATPQHEDTTLLLRLTKTLGATLIMLPDTLVVIHTEEARWSTGSVFDWRAALHWGLDIGALLTPRAFSGFVLVTLGSQAADQGDRAGAPALLSAAFRHGAPTLRQMLLFTAFWVVPPGLRRSLRAGLARLGARTAGTAPKTGGSPAKTGGSPAASATTIGTGMRC